MSKVRLLSWAVAMVLVAGCNKPALDTQKGEAPAEQDSQATGATTAATPENAQVNMTGSMTLRLFEPDLEGGESREASFEISSPQCSLLEDGVWALTPATAIIYGKDGEQTTFEAGSAEFNENADTASLRDGVTVDFGQQHVELADMMWSNADSLATSEDPLTLTDGETKLTAQGMEFHADSKILRMKGVTGTVNLQQGEKTS